MVFDIWERERWNGKCVISNWVNYCTSSNYIMGRKENGLFLNVSFFATCNIHKLCLKFVMKLCTHHFIFMNVSNGHLCWITWRIFIRVKTQLNSKTFAFFMFWFWLLFCFIVIALHLLLCCYCTFALFLLRTLKKYIQIYITYVHIAIMHIDQTTQIK